MIGLVRQEIKTAVPTSVLLPAEKTKHNRRRSETGCGKETVKVKSNDCQNNARNTED